MTTPDEANASGQVAAPPGGPLLAVAKRAAEHVLWTRVAVQRRAEARRGYAANRPIPRTVPATAVLRTEGDWQRAVEEARHLRLPLHRDLLRLRREDPVLRDLGTDAVTVEACAPSGQVLLVRYISEAGHRLLVINIGDDYPSPMNDPLYAPPPDGSWTQLWSSEHPQYGGTGSTTFDDDAPWLIRANTATLLGSSTE